MAGTQSLFDTLAGSFGHGVDRPGLNAFVANSQATNGLRSAQTEEALTKAQQAQEEMAASDQLEGSLGAVKDDNGNPMLNPSAVHLVASELKGHYGDAKTVMAALGEMQKVHNTGIISNPDNLNSPATTAALAGNTNKLPEAAAVPKEYSVAPGITPPTVLQTPLGAAETQAASANADLRQHNAAKPFAPAGGPALDDDAAYNAAVRYNMFGSLPAFGMGASAGASRAKVLQMAAQLSHDPTWQPPSWQQGAPATAPQPGQAPGTAVAVPSGHPSLQQATDTAASPTDLKSQQAALTDMTKRTSVADASEQTALKNLQVARDTLAQADQTGSPLANSIVNKVRAGMFGDPQVSAYQNAISTARNEYARVISMATGAQGITDHAMREGQKLFPDDLSPAQFETNFAVAQKDMANRTASLHDQISNFKKGIHTPQGSSATPAVTPPAATSGIPAGWTVTAH